MPSTSRSPVLLNADSNGVEHGADEILTSSASEEMMAGALETPDLDPDTSPLDEEPANRSSNESLPFLPQHQKSYDYLLKVLLVGDSDVGKQEILGGLEDGTLDSPFCSSPAGAAYKTTTILIDGKRVKLQLWDTSGQGRFCTIIRSYSRGAQGILLVYDITNKWSFEGIDRWLKEVDQVTFFTIFSALVFGGSQY